jgi:hypothetical protein
MFRKARHFIGTPSLLAGNIPLGYLTFLGQSTQRLHGRFMLIIINFLFQKKGMYMFVKKGEV